MDKVLNRRYVLGATVCLCAGAVTGGAIVHNLILQIVIPIVVAAVGILLFFFKRKFLFAALLCFAVGVSVLSIDVAISRVDVTEGYYTFEGRVYSVGENEVLFDEVKLDNKTVRGKMKSAPDGEYQEGQVVRFFCKVSDLEVDFFDTYSARDYLNRAYCKVEPMGEKTVVGVKKGIFEKIRDRIHDGLTRVLSDEDAAISESLLFGDKTDLSSFDREMIAGIGMSHVFAVSGLHVGFLTAAVVFFLKKLRIKHLPRLIVTAVVLVVYGFLTGFPAGLKRAAIMAFFYLLAPIVKGKSDAPTSLSAACFIIVLTNPREVFSLGFLMSVSAVGGIILFSTPISRVMRRLFRKKGLKRIFDAVATTIAANLFLLPVLFNVFRVATPYALVGNLVVLPLVTLLYFYLAVVTPFAAISPVLGILYFPMRYLITAIRSIGTLIYYLPHSTVAVPTMGVFCVFFYLSLLFLSRLNKLPYKVKVPVSSALFLTSLLGFIF